MASSNLTFSESSFDSCFVVVIFVTKGRKQKLLDDFRQCNERFLGLAVKESVKSWENLLSEPEDCELG